MSRFWKIIVVLALGVSVDVDIPWSTTAPGFFMHVNGPTLAIFIYGILALITLIKALNHLPGVFALGRPLGVVQSGYEYLWTPAILTVLIGFIYRGGGGNRPWTIVYGASHKSNLSLIALGVFAALMLSLKFRACMIEANRRLECNLAEEGRWPQSWEE